MSKTIFSSGSYLDSTFCNSLYQTGGGHIHDAGTSDGHSSKINLASHTTGILPWDNQSHHVVPMVERCEISMPDVKTISVASGWIGQSNGGNAIHITGPWIKKIINTGGTDYETFAAGNGATYGGVASGMTIADRQWLHVFVLYNGSTYDIGCDANIYATNLLGMSWLYYKRIGSILILNNAGSYEIRPYHQHEDFVTWATRYSDDSTSIHSNDVNFLFSSTMKISVPPDVAVAADVKLNAGHGSGAIDYFGASVYDTTRTDTTRILDQDVMNFFPATNLYTTYVSHFITDRTSAAKVTVQGFNAATWVRNIDIEAKSYVDPR